MGRQVDPNSLAARARAVGIPASYFRKRQNLGLSFDELVAAYHYYKRARHFRKAVRPASDATRRAELAGLDPRLVRSRVHNGKTLDEAIAMGPPQGMQSTERSRRAREAGLDPGLVRARVASGKSVDEAIAMGPAGSSGRGGMPISETTRRAREAGLKPDLIYSRMHGTRKMTLDEAIAMGPARKPNGRPLGEVTQRAVAAGLPPNLIHHRIHARGKTLDEAIAMGPPGKPGRPRLSETRPKGLDKATALAKGLSCYQGRICSTNPDHGGNRYVRNDQCIECYKKRIAEAPGFLSDILVDQFKPRFEEWMASKPKPEERALMLDMLGYSIKWLRKTVSDNFDPAE
jgi:hypothetical protein